MFNSLGECLRIGRKYDDALAAYLSALEIDPDNVAALSNVGRLLIDTEEYLEAATVFEGVLARTGDSADSLFAVGRSYFFAKDYETAVSYLRRVVDGGLAEANGRLNAQVHLMLGTALFHIGKLEDAIDVLSPVPSMDDDIGNDSLVNLGACYHLLGRFEEALEIYRRALLVEKSSMSLNNMAAIYTIQHKDKEAFETLSAALKLDPNCHDCMTNLASVHQERGFPDDLDAARWLYRRAYELNGRDGILIRSLMGMPTILPSTVDEIVAYRDAFEAGLDELLARGNLTLENIPKDVERMPFALVYQGFNDRVLQEKFATLLFRATPSSLFIADHLLERAMAAAGAGAGAGASSSRGVLPSTTDTALTTGARKIRVAFLSKFFTMNHAHGQLLRGVMAGLDRRYFTIIIITITNPQEFLNPEVLETAHEVYHLPLVQAEGRRILASVKADVLIFADQMSEPHSYSYAMGRFAGVQATFWGNPTTAGHIDSVDYFMSGDRLETDTGQDHYTSQLMRLGGQGIWYDPIYVPPPRYLGDRAKYGLQPDWVVYACPQSTFKMHPEYDAVLARILRAVPNARLLMVEGRRPAWTTQLKARLQAAMPDVYSRILFYQRLPNSDHFMTFLSVVDVLLHPFPFGGSKTAADGFAVGVPVVTWPQDHLRGRMAHTFYHTMGLPQLIATSADDYVDKAVTWGTDRGYNHQIRHAIKRLNDLIWSREEVVMEWELFFLNSVSYAPAVRVAARQKLDAINDRDARILATRHAELQAELATLPPPPPPPAPTVDGSGAVVGGAAAAAPPKPWDGPFSDTVTAAIVASQQAFSAGESQQVLLVLSDALTGAAVDGEPAVAQAVLHNHLGSALFQQWRLEDAAAHFEQAARLAPDFPDPYNGMGVALMANKDVDGAIQWFDAALQRDSRHKNGLYNLGRALQEAGRVLDAAATYAKLLQLSPVRGGLEIVLCVGMTAPVWAGPDLPHVDERIVHAFASALVEDRWVDQGLFSSVSGAPTDGEAFWKQVSGIRGEWLYAVNSLSVMLGKTHLNRMYECSSLLRRMAQVAEADDDRTAYRQSRATVAGEEEGGGGGGAGGGVAATGDQDHQLLHVVIQYYAVGGGAAERPRERQDELTHCLRANLDNPSVAAVHVLLESDADRQALAAAVDAATYPHRAAKLVTVDVGTRMTYEMAFVYASTRLAGNVVAVANADVYFDDSLEPFTQPAGRAALFDRTVGGPVVAAILRWEQTPWGTLRWVPRVDSQDAWLFRSPLTLPGHDFAADDLASVVQHQSAGTSSSPFAFTLGAPRCDYRVAHLLQAAGAVLRNPSLHIHVVHVHANPDRQYNDADEVSGAGALVPIDVVL